MHTPATLRESRYLGKGAFSALRLVGIASQTRDLLTCISNAFCNDVGGTRVTNRYSMCLCIYLQGEASIVEGWILLIPFHPYYYLVS